MLVRMPSESIHGANRSSMSKGFCITASPSTVLAKPDAEITRPEWSGAWGPGSCASRNSHPDMTGIIRSRMMTAGSLGIDDSFASASCRPPRSRRSARRFREPPPPPCARRDHPRREKDFEVVGGKIARLLVRVRRSRRVQPTGGSRQTCRWRPLRWRSALAER